MKAGRMDLQCYDVLYNDSLQASEVPLLKSQYVKKDPASQDLSAWLPELAHWTSAGKLIAASRSLHCYLPCFAELLSNSFRYSPYPSFTISSFAMNLSAAEFIQ